MKLLEMNWQATSRQSGRVMTCGIYRTDGGIETRASYAPDELLRSHRVTRMRAAREIAKAWRAAVLQTGTFTEVIES